MKFKEFYKNNQHIFWIIGIIIAILLAIYFNSKQDLSNEKKDISENIDIAKNLIKEMEKNEWLANNVIPQLNRTKGTNEVMPDLFKTLRTEQAIAEPTFGTDEIRVQLDWYLDSVKVIKDSMEIISKDLTLKSEHIDRAILWSKFLVEGNPPLIKTDDLVNKIQNYIKIEEEKLRTLDKNN